MGQKHNPNHHDVKLGFDLPRLPGIGGTVDQPCPLCSPWRRKKKLKCLRVWRPEPDWLTYHCVHCGEHGYAFRDGVERQLDPAVLDRLAAARFEREAAERRVRIDDAKRIYRLGWSESPTIDAYFAHRGLEIPEIARKQLRYDPLSRFAEGNYDAILMPFRDFASYQFTAVHRIAVDLDGRPIRVEDRKLKKSLGAVLGSAMMWGRAGSTLTVCEGLETAFAVQMAGLCEDGPVWALSGASFIEQFWPWPGTPVRRLIIAADHDEAGMRAAERCARNWRERAMVDIHWPDEEGTDYADHVGG